MAGMYGNLMVVSNTYNQSQSYYSVIDLETRTVTASYSSPHLPHPIVVDSDKKIAYMMGVDDASVVVIDMTTGQPQETFALTGGGGQLAVSKKFNKFYTSSSAPGTATASFDLTTRQSLGTIGFSGLTAPGSSIAIDETGQLMFVVLGDDNAIGIADAKTLKPLGYIQVGRCPYGVRVDAPRNRAFVTNSGSHSLTMIDLEKVRDAVD